mmetsp:Transcript_7232/g.17556  ORF Transcript_7232/g.17556 Transcript_7232/m.17556 type:complete len:82 (+) Transcript_7232:424-669(+)
MFNCPCRASDSDSDDVVCPARLRVVRPCHAVQRDEDGRDKVAQSPSASDEDDEPGLPSNAALGGIHSSMRTKSRYVILPEL